MLSKLRIRNLRSIIDTNEIELKPITILVGKNSSGKSTFARSFPLLRQSIEEKTRGPILWYGRYVDFGDYHTSLSRSATSNEICFEFHLSYPEKIFQIQRNISSFHRQRPKPSNQGSLKVKTSINLSFDKSTYISNLRLDIFGCSIQLQLNKEELISLSINNNFYWKKTEDQRCLLNYTGILPDIDFFKRTTRVMIPPLVPAIGTHEITLFPVVYLGGQTLCKHKLLPSTF